ncbi:MAG: translocation/assembly module TamB domain-containing protein [Planctomycetes bacterium]|nr:translocation/assembly module TamB domain-containing protein [Planctomycetota bacterium]
MTATSGGPVRRRRALFGWIALVLAGLVVAAYVMRATWIAPWVVARIAKSLRDEHGLELSVGGVGGNWLTTVDVADARLAKLDGSLRIEARELHARFSLLGLLRGNPSAIEFVDARGVDIAFDEEQRAPSSGKPEAFVWPARWPRFELADAHVAANLGGGRRIELTGLAASSSDGAQVVARATRAAFASPETAWPAAECAAELRVNGGRFEFSRFDADGRALLESGVLDLTELGAGGLAWDARFTPEFGRIGTRGRLADHALNATATFEGVDGARLRAEFPPLARFAWTGTVDAEAQVTAALHAGGAFEIAVRGVVRDGEVLNQRFERLTTELVATRASLVVSRLEGARGADRLTANALVVPFGVADPAERWRGMRGHVALDSSDFPAWVGSDALGADVPPHHLHVAATFTESGIVLDEGRIATASGVLDVDEGRIVLGATDERWLADARVDLAGRADFPDLAELGGVLGREGWCGSARGRVTLVGNADGLSGDVDLVGSNVVVEDRELGDVELAARVDRERVRVTRAHAAGAWGEFEVAGEFDYRERRLFDVTATARLVAPSPWMPAVLGSGTVEARASLDGPLSEPRVDFAVAARDFAIGERVLESVDARGRWQGTRVRFDHLVARSSGLEVVATAELSSLDWHAPYALALESLHAEREGRSLDLVAPVDLRIGDGSLDFDHAHLAGDAGRWIAACHWQKERVVVALELVELSPLGLFDPFLPPGVDLDGLRGKFEVLREGDRSTAAIDLAIDRVRLEKGGRTYSLATRALFDQRRLAIEQFEIRDGQRRVVALTGSAPLDPFSGVPFVDGALALQGTLALEDLDEIPQAWRPLGAAPSGQVALDFTLGGTWRELTGRVAFEACELELDGAGRFAGRRLGPWDVDLALDFGPEVHVEHLVVEDRGRGRAFVTGDLHVAPRVLDWVEGEPPLASDVGLALSASATIGDLSFVRRLVPELGRTDGRLAVEVALGASLEAPTWSGSMTLEQGEVRFERELPTLTGLTADVVFDGYTAKLNSFSGALGAGPFHGSGSLDFTGDVPSVDLTVVGEEILLARGEHLRLRADAELSLRGAFDALRIGGDLRLRDGRYTQNFELLDRLGGTRRGARTERVRGFELPSLTTGPFARAEFDVTVRSTDPLRIDNNVLHATLRPNLRLRGLASAPTLSGPIFVEEARILLPSGTLRIVGGTATLPEANPVIPKLKLRGESRMAGYDVVATLDGEYDDPIVLSSTPPLSQSDLLVMLLTGRPPANSLSATSERAAQTVAVYLGQDVLSRWFQGDDGESVVERIEWLQGQELTRSGGQTTQVSVRLTDDPGGAGRIVYLRGEKDVYDRVNFGVKLLFRFP